MIKLVPVQYLGCCYTQAAAEAEQTIVPKQPCWSRGLSNSLNAAGSEDFTVLKKRN